MSIKIIKNTMVDPITVKCENCKSVISYNFDDIQRENHSNIIGTGYVERFIVCPVCKANIDLTK